MTLAGPSAAESLLSLVRLASLALLLKQRSGGKWLADLISCSRSSSSSEVIGL